MRRGSRPFVVMIIACSGAVLLWLYGSEVDPSGVTVAPVTASVVRLSDEFVATSPEEIGFCLKADHGDTEVRLLNKSCGCLDVLESGRKLRIGDSVFIREGEEHKLSLSFRSPMQRESDYSVVFEDGRREITFRAHVVSIPPLFATPARPILKWLEQEQVFSTRFDVTGTARDPYRVGRGIEVSFESPVEDGIIAMTDLGAAEEIATGLFQKKWRIEAKLPAHCLSQRDVSAQVNCRVRWADMERGFEIRNLPCILVRNRGIQAPQSLYFSKPHSGDICSRTFVVRSLDGRAFCIRPAIPSDSPIRLRWENREAIVHRLSCELTYPESGAFSTIVTIPTTHPDCPQVEVAVRAQ